MLKKILCALLIGATVLSTPTIALAAETIPNTDIIMPRYTDVNTRNISVNISSGKVNCEFSLSAYQTTTSITGTLTLSGSDGSERSWNVSGTGRVRVSKSITATADEYTLTFSGTCGRDDVYLEDTTR